MSAEYRSFEEFWPYYLSQHSKPVTRALHAAGLAFALLGIALAFAFGHGAWAALAPVIGYGFSWIGHFGFERNRPATFRYPLWSLRGDFRMIARMAAGKPLLPK